MILADKITEERKKNGWSQEELADRLSVSRQAVSKWESAQSVPDVQRIIQMAELFCVSTDYLLKDEMETAPVSYANSETEYNQSMRRVSMEEANLFLEMKQKNAPKIANATSLCILSPALLIFLCGLAGFQIGPFSAAGAAGIGLIVLFGMIAIAVFMFITCGMGRSWMTSLEKENFETEYGVTGMVKEKQYTYEPVFTRGIAIGVVLCIVAVVPLILSVIMEAPGYISAALVSLVLVELAVAVNMMIRVSIIKSSYDTLLQEGDFSKLEKRAKQKRDAFHGAYWCTVTAIYLGWSFWTMRWDITWVIWPVAGVLFAAFASIIKLLIPLEA